MTLLRAAGLWLQELTDWTGRWLLRGTLWLARWLVQEVKEWGMFFYLMGRLTWLYLKLGRLYLKLWYLQSRMAMLTILQWCIKCLKQFNRRSK